MREAERKEKEKEKERGRTQKNRTTGKICCFIHPHHTTPISQPGRVTRPRSWAKWLGGGVGEEEVLLWNWTTCCFPFEPWPGCRHKFPLPSRPTAEGWLTPVVSQVFSLRLGRRWAGKGSQTQSTGSAKESPCSQTKELDGSCMWERGRWLGHLAVHFPESSWISSLSSFRSLFLLLSLAFSSGRLSFLAKFPFHIFPFSLPPPLALTSSLSCFLATL